MSYGLWNTPATFQHLMNQVVVGLENCTVHLDDVINYSETWIGHLCPIPSLLTRQVEVSLTVNLANCEFSRATVTYLGKVTEQG